VTKIEIRRTNYKHGYSPRGTRAPEYRAWMAMKRRCLTPSCGSYVHYGAKGVTICERWVLSFVAFLEDMGPRPEGTTLDRIRNAEGYSPSNCRWATTTQQQRNRTNNRPITINGITRLLVEWAEQTNMSVQAFRKRVSTWPESRWLEPRKRT